VFSVGKDNERLLLNELRKWILYSAAMALVILCGAYTYLNWQSVNGNIGLAGLDLVKEMIVQFIPLTVLFLISSLIFNKYADLRDKVAIEDTHRTLKSELKGVIQRALIDGNVQQPIIVHDSFDHIDWDKRILNASQIKIIVHYLDSWTRYNSAALQGFFAGGGRLQVVIPDYENPELIRNIQPRLPGLDVADVERKLRCTHENLINIIPAERAAEVVLETSFVDKIVWYSAFCIDDKVLFLSPFEHQRGVNIGSPVTEIDLETYPAIRAWLHRETEHLISIRKGVRTNVPERARIPRLRKQ
jgi:hypothetical protein